MVTAKHKSIEVSPTTLRLDPELREALQKSADANGRSVSKEIAFRLQNSFGMKHGPTLSKIIGRDAGMPGKGAQTLSDSKARNTYDVQSDPADLADNQVAMLTLFNALPRDKQRALLQLLG